MTFADERYMSPATKVGTTHSFRRILNRWIESQPIHQEIKSVCRRHRSHQHCGDPFISMATETPATLLLQPVRLGRRSWPKGISQTRYIMT